MKLSERFSKHNDQTRQMLNTVTELFQNRVDSYKFLAEDLKKEDEEIGAWCENLFVQTFEFVLQSIIITLKAFNEVERRVLERITEWELRQK